MTKFGRLIGWMGALRGMAAARWVGIVLLQPVIAMAQAPAAGGPALIPVADFFRNPVVSDLVVSPSGRYVAAAMKGGERGRQRLVMLDLQDLSKSKPLIAFSDADVNRISWVNDERLVVSVTDNQEAYGYQKYAGLFAIDREGTEPLRRLIARQFEWVTRASLINNRELSPQHRFHGVIRDGSDDVLITKWVGTGAGELDHVSLLRLNTKTGLTRSLSQDAPDHVTAWAVNREGMPHALVTSHGGAGALYFRGAADDAWKLIRQFDLYQRDTSQAPYLYRVGPGQLVYASGRADPKDDVQSLLSIDMSRGEFKTQTLLALQGYDFSGTLVMGAAGQLLGVQYLSDARGSYWFDKAMAAIQAKVDMLLPGTVNLLQCGECADPTRVIVSSYSDRMPKAYYLYDVKHGTVELLMRSLPWIEPARMATQDLQRFAARDGMMLPVHVTRPQGVTGPAPMIVLVHGGPWIRGREWAWEPEAQFLASRGYVVVEPEFRGSTGFGSKLFTAGFKQWGLAMQDDVADAALWAIKQGYADPKRVCVAGASYGGYATLMGLIRHPEIFRCGVEWVGVSDIDLMYSITWSDSSDQWKEYGMPVRVGDRAKDAKQLAETSPIKLAGQLKQPLLMAYGSDDKRVPIEHGQKMRSALAPHNPNVEWIVYPDEGHGWMLEANCVDFWTRVEKFLDKNLKNPP